MEQYITPGSLVDHRYKKQYKEKALISAATPIGAVYDRIPAINQKDHNMESGERTRETWTIKKVFANYWMEQTTEY